VAISVASRSSSAKRRVPRWNVIMQVLPFEVGAHPGEVLRRAAVSAQAGQHVRAGIGGPLPDRGERPRPRDHRRDPDGQQAS
jgi:hypothetical protein